jgi:hypothetical protein
VSNWFVRDEPPSAAFYLWRGDKGYVQIWQEFTEWFGSCNWYNFTFILLAFEDDPYIAHREISIGLLGFRARIIWSTGVDTPVLESMRKAADEIMEHPERVKGLKDILGGDAK